MTARFSQLLWAVLIYLLICGLYWVHSPSLYSYLNSITAWAKVSSNQSRLLEPIFLGKVFFQFTTLFWETFFIMSFNNSTSSTDVSAVPVASWTYLSCIFTVATILSIFCNGVLILFFITDRDLRTPFNIYMINVLTANFLCSCVQNPLEVVNNIYPNFWLGPSVCTLYQYGAYVLQVVFDDHPSMYQCLFTRNTCTVGTLTSWQSRESISTVLCHFIRFKRLNDQGGATVEIESCDCQEMRGPTIYKTRVNRIVSGKYFSQ